MHNFGYLFSIAVESLILVHFACAYRKWSISATLIECPADHPVHIPLCWYASPGQNEHKTHQQTRCWHADLVQYCRFTNLPVNSVPIRRCVAILCKVPLEDSPGWQYWVDWHCPVASVDNNDWKVSSYVTMTTSGATTSRSLEIASSPSSLPGQEHVHNIYTCLVVRWKIDWPTAVSWSYRSYKWSAQVDRYLGSVHCVELEAWCTVLLLYVCRWLNPGTTLGE